jgi:hypothetical protein
MAQITVNNDVHSGVDKGRLWGPYWTSPTTGYIVVPVNLSQQPINVYKTTDSGATWSAITTGRPNSVGSHIACWFDKNTSGDTGTKIHFAFFDGRPVYKAFDTSNDTWGSTVVINGSIASDDVWCGITKSRGGNLYAVWEATGASNGRNDVWRSTDGGANWTQRANIIEGNTTNPDRFLLFPANLADNQDIWCLYYDHSAGEVSLKTYDDSANSVSENSIDASVIGNITYPVFPGSGAVRHSDGNLLIALANAVDSASGDLVTYDIANGTTITAKTNILTNKDDWYYPALFINQQNNDIYVAYAGKGDGSETFTTTVGIYYVKSTNGMSTWGTEQIYEGTTLADYRFISVGDSVGNAGGRFMPTYFNDDLNDVYVEDANDIEIAAVVAKASVPWYNRRMRIYTRRI